MDAAQETGLVTRLDQHQSRHGDLYQGANGIASRDGQGAWPETVTGHQPPERVLVVHGHGQRARHSHVGQVFLMNRRDGPQHAPGKIQGSGVAKVFGGHQGHRRRYGIRDAADAVDVIEGPHLGGNIAGREMMVEVTLNPG